MTKEEANKKIIHTIMNLLKEINSGKYTEDDNDKLSSDTIESLYKEYKDVIEIQEFDEFFIYVNEIVLKHRRSL